MPEDIGWLRMFATPKAANLIGIRTLVPTSTQSKRLIALSEQRKVRFALHQTQELSDPANK
jgi:hypothetical protein